MYAYAYSKFKVTKKIKEAANNTRKCRICSPILYCHILCLFFAFLQKLPQAELNGLAVRMRPVGCSLGTPGVVTSLMTSYYLYI